MIKKWVIGNPDAGTVAALAERGGITPLAAKALVCAGADTVEKAAALLGGGDGEDVFSDPFLIRDMEKACSIVSEAVDSGELICVYGDYDCDGITSTAVMAGYLTDIGGNVTTYINERSEGYGMNCAAVRKLHEDGVKVIITVDNGIAAIEEAKLCRELGITLVITDHHQAGETLPDAEAVVDPHRRDCPSAFKELCGCGLALKFIAAMEGGDMDFAMEQYSDLAAIATVADVVPLKGENREIVRRGLHYLENTENRGLRALVEKSGMKTPYTSVAAAFQLGPRINASGRVGSPLEALNMLMCEDPEEAESYADNLCEMNSRRRKIEADIMDEVIAQVNENPHLLDSRILVFRGKGWNHGIVGIAATKCLERFGKPVFLMSANEGETELRGSARSIKGINVFKALSFAADSLVRFGGHSLAGGFSLKEEDFERFDSLLQQYAEEQAKAGVQCVPSLEVSGTVTAAELTVENVAGIDVLEPFGEGNPRPVFLLQGCVISEIIPVSEGAHTRVVMTSGNDRITGMMFGTRTEEFPLRTGDEVNAVISPDINTFNNRQSVNIKIVDIRLKGLVQAKLIAAEDAWCSFRRGEKPDSRLIPHITPERNDLVAVYKAAGTDRLSPQALYSRLDTQMNYCRFLLCLDIFAEAGLMEFDRGADRVSVISGAAKADTELSPTMQRLRSYS